MNNDTNNQVDLLQIKIENAKAKLPVETTNAIAAIDWKAAILSMREKRGYSFEQLGDLELETELLLCGLTTPEEYPKELQNRMKLSKAETDELVNEMNNLVFKKIKEELIKNSERKKIFQKNNPAPIKADEVSEQPSASKGINDTDTEVLKSAGIEVVPARNALGIADAGGKAQPIKPSSILGQNLFTTTQAPIVKTEHTLENIPSAETKIPESAPAPNKTSTIDPYREIPE